MRQIKLIPFSNVLDISINAALDGIKEQLNVEALTGESIELPEDCFMKSRSQYLSDCLIKTLKSLDNSYILLGITEEDIYTSGMNFIFGQAELGGSKAIVSTSRLKNTFYGEKELKEPLFIRRVKTEVLHELGHIFSLEHCDNPYCVMNYSNSIADTDRKGFNYCSVCSNLLLNSKLKLLNEKNDCKIKD